MDKILLLKTNLNYVVMAKNFCKVFKVLKLMIWKPFFLFINVKFNKNCNYLRLQEVLVEKTRKMAKYATCSVRVLSGLHTLKIVASSKFNFLSKGSEFFTTLSKIKSIVGIPLQRERDCKR